MRGESPRTGRTTLLALAAIVIFTVVVRARLADVPLERDEGEYAYAGQLLLAGVPPYAEVYNMKFPGTYYAYAAILAIGGPSARAIHLGLLVVNVASILLLYGLARRLFDSVAAVVAAGCFALLALDRGVMGPWAHATHFALLFALAGLLLLAREPARPGRGRLVLAGLLLGTAVVMKQHAAAFLLAGMVMVGLAHRSDGRLDRRAAARAALWLAAGFALPLAALATLLFAQGVFSRFWFWTVRYGMLYVAAVPVADVFHNLRYGLAQVVGPPLALWLLAAAGLVLLVVLRWPAHLRARLLTLTVASFLAVCPGFYFREHYFILLLPAVALLATLAVEAVRRLLLHAGRGPRTARLGALALAFLCAGHYVVRERHYLFALAPDEIARSRYRANLFVDTAAIAAYVREHSQPSDRIAVLGSEPQVFFYAQRRSASGYIYTYPMMEQQPYALPMQQAMIRDIESARPAYLLMVKAFPSWLLGPESDRTIFAWARGYLQAHYEEVGRVDGDGTGRTRLWLPEPGPAPQPPATTLARLYRRLPAAPGPADEPTPAKAQNW